MIVNIAYADTVDRWRAHVSQPPKKEPHVSHPLAQKIAKLLDDHKDELSAAAEAAKPTFAEQHLRQVQHSLATAEAAANMIADKEDAGTRKTR